MTMKKRISEFMLNFMLLEAAKDHFACGLPNNSPSFKDFFKKINDEGLPLVWDRKNNRYVDVTETNAKMQAWLQSEGLQNTDVNKCWYCLKTIRNNLFHGNKAAEPDPHPRLEFLLDWALALIDELLKDQYPIGIKVKEINPVLGIN